MAENRISLEQVRHVARLARLELSAAEEQSIQADLSAILAYVDKLNQLDTSEVEPTAQVGETGTPMRPDAHGAPGRVDMRRARWNGRT